ncbi:MAG: MFS transporter [Chloroflexota bacterium]|nr:MFS transporter [Chloroflexota bacterium]MDE2883980.1 MFS transporter [Chloroflexota bacterium]
MDERGTEQTPGLLSKEALPVFSAFFLWGFGTGALWMARPLLAFDLSASVILVGLASAFSAAPRMIGGPVAGTVADRLGRRPVVVAGAVLHGGAAAMQAFTDSYAVFLGLELISGLGVAVWMTGSAALLADFTRVTNRGRGVALRNTSMRLGILAGPAAGGIIAAAFDIRAVFIFIAVTKVFIVAVALLLIREVRQAPTPAPRTTAEAPRGRFRLDVSVFRTRNFVTLSVVTLAVGLVTAGPGAFRTYFPVHAEDVGLTFSEIGVAISLSGVLATAASMPAGGLVDWWGRRPMLLVGLVAMAAGMFLVSGMDALLMAVVVASAFSLGEVVGTNTLQTYAMDLAPRDKRGYFLGTWQATMDFGHLAGPLLAGALASPLGLPAAFAIIGGVLLLAAAFMVVSRAAPDPRGADDVSAP